MGVLDRLWWRLNGRPPTVKSAYIALVSTWVLVGISLMLGLVTAAIAWPWGALVLLFPAAYGGYQAYRDSKDGYMQMIYELRVLARAEKMQKFGLKEGTKNGESHKKGGRRGGFSRHSKQVRTKTSSGGRSPNPYG